jgi:CubicO group peptidase (beta-lactamase class C family)
MAEQLRDGDPEEAGMSAPRIRHASGLAQRWVAEGHTSVLVVLVARRGRIVLHEAFGRLTPEPDAPALPREAIFPLASITKPITATAVLCLVEDGLLGLNRPVQEYLPEFVGVGKERVLVYHLLTHTSGLREEDVAAHRARKKPTTGLPAPAENQHPLAAERLFLAYDTPLGKQPGSEMAYCTFGFELLDEIVRRVSGRAISDFTSERIFQPLGMRDTSYGLPSARRHRLARRYPESSVTAATGYAADFETRAYQESPRSVYSTALDLAIFGQMFCQHGRYGAARVLSPASVAVMTRNQIAGVALSFDDEFFPEASWGLGWEVQGEKRPKRAPSLRSARTFEHVGSGGTYLWVDPFSEIVGVYFCLLRHGAPGLRPAWRGDLFIDAVTAAIDA